MVCIFYHYGLKNSNYFLKLLFNKLIQNQYLNKLDGIHCVSNEEKNELSRFTYNKNIFVINNGIDIEKIELKLKFLKFDSSKKPFIYIGFLGRVEKEKNILALIKALSLLDQNTLKKIKLLIIGGIKENKYGKQVFKQPVVTCVTVLIFNLPFDASTIKSIKLLLIIPT